MALNIRMATMADLDSCFGIESVSYGVEGATRERIQNRIERYPEGFLVVENSGTITGFINSCCSDDDDLSNEGIKAMVTHKSSAKFLIVLSVVVSPEFRGQGYAKALLEAYLLFADTQHKTVLLMCRQEHTVLYEKQGFMTIKKSGSKHGGIEWFEMSRLPNNR